MDQDLKKFEAELEDERKQQQQVHSQTLKSTGGKKLAQQQHGAGLGKVPRKKYVRSQLRPYSPCNVVV